MELDPEKISEDFLEISSEQRLRILLILLEKKAKIATLAKELDATNPEVHRNINRLLKNGLVKKETDGNFTLSIYGHTICTQIPLLDFVSSNKKFFENHTFGDLALKFIQRLGALHGAKRFKGVVKVIEKWNEIHQNAQKYIYNILPEIPYSEDIIKIVESKLQSGINIRSIFAENTIVSEKRDEIFKKKNFRKHIQEGILERKMENNVSIATLLNEKEACIIFPKLDNEPDMSEIFYSSDPQFHEWCLDFFNDSWKKAGSFQESKLKD